MQGFVGMLMANNNTEKSLNGLGALKGAPCVLSSLEEILDSDKKVIGNRLTFTWTGNDGTVESKSFDVLNGKDGSGSEESASLSSDEISAICVIPK